MCGVLSHEWKKRRVWFTKTFRITHKLQGICKRNECQKLPCKNHNTRCRPLEANNEVALADSPPHGYLWRQRRQRIQYDKPGKQKTETSIRQTNRQRNIIHYWIEHLEKRDVDHQVLIGPDLFGWVDQNKIDEDRVQEKRNCSGNMLNTVLDRQPSGGHFGFQNE